MSLIISKRQQGRNIRLIMALPCQNQDARWNHDQSELYHNLLAKADEVVHVSEEYHHGCMKKRNYYMVEHSAYCIRSC
jgi:uncharacterized phage-like protein YoqJ